MRGSQKPKRLTWASDVNLCQVKLFLSEDSPSQIGIGTQDHLQAKAQLLSAQTGGGMGSDVNLPPGFEGVQPWPAKLTQIPLIKWKLPPRLKVNIDWQVVAGEESKEMETQNQREMRVLEAIYPRPSAIPPNPTPAGIGETTHDDHHTPVIPVTPIEDEDTTTIDTPLGSGTNPVIPHPQDSSLATHSSQGNNSAIVNPRQPDRAEPDIVAAAQVVLTSIMAMSNQGNNNNNNNNNNNLIDPGLLIKILRDPKMIEQLKTNPTDTSSSCLQATPAVGSRNSLPSGPPSSSNPNFPSTTTSSMHYVPNSRPAQNIPVNRRDPPLSAGGAASRPMPPPPGPSYPPPSPPIGAPVTKDMSYFKSLIQQHGLERRETSAPGPHFGGHQDNMNAMMKPRESKPKLTRPCFYFNTPKGCRNGADCLYQHDISSAQKRIGGGAPEVQSAKRAKVDSDVITGS